MNTKRIIAVLTLTWMLAFPAWSAPSLWKSAEWPFSPPSLFLKGGVNAVTAGSDLLFWAVGDTIAVVDKANFTLLATFQVKTSTAIQDILFDEAGDILYVAAGYDAREQSGGLQIFGVSNPSFPVLVGIFEESPGNPGSSKTDDAATPVPHVDARGLGLNGNTLFLADDNFGLRVLDVEDPANPTEIPLTTPTADRTSGYKQPDIYGNFAATGGYIGLSLHTFDEKVYAFVLDFFYGIKMFDVTDPGVIADPLGKETKTDFWYGSLSLLTDLFVTETEGRLTAFVTGGDATGKSFVLSRMDVSFEPSKTITNLGRCITPGEARSVAVSGNYAYVADGVKGLTVVDIVNGTLLENEKVLTYSKVGSYTTNADYSYNVFLDGAVLYLASGESGLNKLNVTVPTAPVYVGRLGSLITGDDVAVAGNHTFMLDRKTGLRIFDTTEPDYPILLSYLGLQGDSADLAVSGDYAFIAKNGGGISVVHIADKTSPVLTGVSIASPAPKKFFISGTRLFIADAQAGLRIADITLPYAPGIISTTATAGEPRSVYVQGNRAYVAEGTSGLEIFNVANPNAPVLVASIPMSNAEDVCTLMIDNSLYALVADGAAGFKIVDTSNLDEPIPAPVVVDDMDTGTDSPSPFTAVSVSVLEKQAYVGLGPDGILVLDLATPLSPKEIDHEASAGFVRDTVPRLIDKTPYITVAEGGLGFRIYSLSSASNDDDGDEDFVPTIDAGCFIGSAYDDENDRGWIRAIAQLFNRLTNL